jgi:hypothetical protein
MWVNHTKLEDIILLHLVNPYQASTGPETSYLSLKYLIGGLVIQKKMSVLVMDLG